MDGCTRSSPRTLMQFFAKTPISNISSIIIQMHLGKFFTIFLNGPKFSFVNIIAGVICKQTRAIKNINYFKTCIFKLLYFFYFTPKGFICFQILCVKSINKQNSQINAFIKFLITLLEFFGCTIRICLYPHAIKRTLKGIS